MTQMGLGWALAYALGLVSMVVMGQRIVGCYNGRI